MKIIPGLSFVVLVAGFVGLVGQGWGQPEDVAVVLKVDDYTQTGLNTVAPNGPHHAIEFFVILGTSPDTVLGSTVGTPAGSNVASSMLSFDALDNQWEYSDGYGSAGMRDADYNDGTYAFGIHFQTAGNLVANLDLAMDVNSERFFVAPNISSIVSGTGFFSGSDLFVNPVSPVVLQIDNLPNYQNGIDVLSVRFYPHGPGMEVEDFRFMPFPSNQFSIGSGGTFDLAPGSYDLEIEYINMVDLDTTSLAAASYTALAGFSTITVTSLTVIPEPATWGWLAGLAALAGVFWVRRKRV